MILKFLILLLFAFTAANDNVFSQKNLWEHIIQMQQIVVSTEYNGRWLNVWKEDAHGYSRFYVTPLCVLITDSVSCSHDKYGNKEQYSFTFKLKLWDQTASSSVKLALNEIGIDVNTNKILPLPMQMVRLSVNKDNLSSEISIDKHWQPYQSLQNEMFFHLTIKNKTFCDEMVNDTKAHPQQFLDGIKLYFQFTIHGGQIAQRNVNITGNTITKLKFFSNLANNYSVNGIVHLRSEDLNDLVQDIYSRVVIDDLSTEGYVSPSEESQMIKDLLDKIKGEQISSTKLSNEDWNSVFWKDIFSRPDIQTEHFNDVFEYDADRVGKEVFSEKGGGAGLTLFGFGGGISGSVKDGSADFHDTANGNISKDLYVVSEDKMDEFATLNNAKVKWTGTKFEPKELNLYRINTKAIQSSGEIFYRGVQITKLAAKQELSIMAEPKHVNGNTNTDGHSYAFGGIFQTCEPLNGTSIQQCENFTQYNTFIGGLKCEDDIFEPVEVFEHVYVLLNSKQIAEVFQAKGGSNVDSSVQDSNISKEKENDHKTSSINDIVKVKLFWCRPKKYVQVPSGKGAMFGGIFEDGEINEATGKFGCPGSYKPYKIGKSVTACLSYNYAQDHGFSIPIGGFFSCQSMNKQCPNEFTQQHAVTDNNCDLYYCVGKSRKLRKKSINSLISKKRF